MATVSPWKVAVAGLVLGPVAIEARAHEEGVGRDQEGERGEEGEHQAASAMWRHDGETA